MKIASITTYDINNGPGVRVTVWVSGCNHKCPGCHNPELQDYLQGYDLKSEEVCEKIITELDKPYISGLTISGGDPLNQSEENLDYLETFILAIKMIYPNKNIWIYTGFAWEELIRYDYIKYIKHADVLVDGRYMQELRDITLPFRGSSNQRIIDINKSIESESVVEIPDTVFRDEND